MTTEELLAALRERGVELSVVQGKLRYRAPAGALDADLRRSAAERRAELEALLSRPAANGWDTAAADCELRKSFAFIDATLAGLWPTQAQRNLLAVFRQQVDDYHTRNNPLLFGAADWIRAHVERWRNACR
jgi:hypothetical protein